MLVIIYKTRDKLENRVIWNLSDRTFPKIKSEEVSQLLATSFEARHIQKIFSTLFSDWKGEDAQEIFSLLEKNFEESNQGK